MPTTITIIIIIIIVNVSVVCASSKKKIKEKSTHFPNGDYHDIYCSYHLLSLFLFFCHQLFFLLLLLLLFVWRSRSHSRLWTITIIITITIIDVFFFYFVCDGFRVHFTLQREQQCTDASTVLGTLQELTGVTLPLLLFFPGFLICVHAVVIAIKVYVSSVYRCLSSREYSLFLYVCTCMSVVAYLEPGDVHKRTR